MRFTSIFGTVPLVESNLLYKRDQHKCVITHTIVRHVGINKNNQNINRLWHKTWSVLLVIIYAINDRVNYNNF